MNPTPGLEYGGQAMVALLLATAQAAAAQGAILAALPQVEPLSFFDQQCEPSGAVTELLQRTARAADMPIEVQILPPAATKARADAHEFDLAIAADGALGIDTESVPVIKITDLAVAAFLPDGDSLQGARIAGLDVAGSYKFAAEYDFELVPYPLFRDAVEAYLDGSVTGLLGTKESIRFNCLALRCPAETLRNELTLGSIALWLYRLPRENGPEFSDAGLMMAMDAPMRLGLYDLLREKYLTPKMVASYRNFRECAGDDTTRNAALQSDPAATP